MNIFKLIVVVAAAVFGYQYWSKHSPGVTTTVTSGNSTDSFIPMPPAEGSSKYAVMIVAAEDCPEEGAQRANALADQLASRGIPVIRSHHLHFDIPNGDPAIAAKTIKLMNGEVPIVLVNGKGKANPGFDEVVAEYKAARR